MSTQKISLRFCALLAICGLAMLAAATRAAAQTETVLYSFGGFTGDGTYPYSTVTLDSSGNIYGTTLDGGSTNAGEIYQLTPNESGGWNYAVIHEFVGSDGSGILAGLTFDASGNLYGASNGGGTYGFGSVYKLSYESGGWVEQMLYSFNGGGSDGYDPDNSLVLDASGNVYGTASEGSTDNNGTVYELKHTAGGGWLKGTIASFDGTDGEGPSYLALGPGGQVFGGTGGGGAYGYGTVFELVPQAGGSWIRRTIYNFQGGTTDGAGGGPIIYHDGHLYGTTGGGGSLGRGTLYELSRAVGGSWSEQILHSFAQSGDCAQPLGALAVDPSGNIYGTCFGGGSAELGGVWEASPTAGGGWTEKLLISIPGGAGGSTALGGITFDPTSGNLYGTTTYDGAYGYGTVFQVTP